jgi:hypothetical protein
VRDVQSRLGDKRGKIHTAQDIHIVPTPNEGSPMAGGKSSQDKTRQDRKDQRQHTMDLPAIKKLIRKRDRLYKRMKQSRDTSHIKNYKEIRRILQKS